MPLGISAARCEKLPEFPAFRRPPAFADLCLPRRTTARETPEPPLGGPLASHHFLPTAALDVDHIAFASFHHPGATDMFPFWIDLSFASLESVTAFLATASWMLVAWFGAARS